MKRKTVWQKRTAAVLASVALFSISTGIAAQAEHTEEYEFGPGTPTAADFKGYKEHTEDIEFGPRIPPVLDMTIYKEHTTAIEGDVAGPLPRSAVIAEKSLSRKQGQSYTTSFTMKNEWNGKPHTDFNIKVSDVTGRYSMIVSSTTGYKWCSESYINIGATAHLQGCEADATYTVSIINENAGPFQAKVNISSYIE